MAYVIRSIREDPAGGGVIADVVKSTGKDRRVAKRGKRGKRGKPGKSARPFVCLQCGKGMKKKQADCRCGWTRPAAPRPAPAAASAGNVIPIGKGAGTVVPISKGARFRCPRCNVKGARGANTCTTCGTPFSPWHASKAAGAVHAKAVSTPGTPEYWHAKATGEYDPQWRSYYEDVAEKVASAIQLARRSGYGSIQHAMAASVDPEELAVYRAALNPEAGGWWSA